MTDLKRWYVEYLTGSDLFCVSEGYWDGGENYRQNVEITFHTSIIYPNRHKREGTVSLWPKYGFEYIGGVDYE
jgi:hypothetical protein